MTETQFRVGVGVIGMVLVAGLTAVSFGGAVSLPPKSAPPATPRGTSSQLLSKSSASPAVYRDFLARDAKIAGVATPSIEEMSRKLPYRVDEVRHVLEAGQPPIEIAGVRLRASRIGDGFALEIENATGVDIAYDVDTTPMPAVRCNAAPVVAYNAMTIAKDQRETRIECGWRDGISLAVTRVQTLELSPLSAWYVSHVPPSVVGIEPRLARGHLAPNVTDRCGFALPQGVRSGLERGEIGWRDLVDFYARHRCQTYNFPMSYRAFRTDGAQIVPAVTAD